MKPAEEKLLFMAKGNTAAVHVTSHPVLEVLSVNTDDFRNEKMYQATMHIARKMYSDGIISKEQYHEIDTIFLQKYKPIFGTLFSDVSLTYD